MTNIKPQIHLSIHTTDLEMYSAFSEAMKKCTPSNIAGKEMIVTSVQTDGSQVKANLSEFSRVITRRDYEGLPPLESTVRIVPGDTTIWDVAEQFVGVDCRLKAIFMLDETRMVAVECIESGQCCCFWASMVRTPEQAKAEERTKACDAIYGVLLTAEREGNRSDMAEALYDAGYRKQVQP